MLQNGWRNEILMVAAYGDDIVFRLRTLAAAMQLHSPAMRAPGVLRGLSPGDARGCGSARPVTDICLDVNGRSACGLGYTLGSGLGPACLRASSVGWPHMALNLGMDGEAAVSVRVLDPASLGVALGGLVLGVGLGVLSTIGNLSASWAEVSPRRGDPGGERLRRRCSLGLRRICVAAQIGSSLGSSTSSKTPYKSDTYDKKAGVRYCSTGPTLL